MSLNLYAKHDGSAHPRICYAQHNLGVLRIELGKLEIAESILENCLSKRYELYGENTPHQETLWTLGTLGMLYRRLNKVDVAISILKRH